MQYFLILYKLKSNNLQFKINLKINISYNINLVIICHSYSTNMRIKTVPRHRMFQSSIKIESASISSSEESDADIGKDSIEAIDNQDSCQVNNYVILSILFIHCRINFYLIIRIY